MISTHVSVSWVLSLPLSFLYVSSLPTDHFYNYFISPVVQKEYVDGSGHQLSSLVKLVAPTLRKCTFLSRKQSALIPPIDDDKQSTTSQDAPRAEHTFEALRLVAGNRVRHARCAPEFVEEVTGAFSTRPYAIT